MLSGGNSTDKNKGTPMKRAKWHLGNYYSIFVLFKVQNIYVYYDSF